MASVPALVRIELMESKLFQQQRGQEIDLALIEATQRLSPEQRLDAFLTHNRLIVELYSAGRQARQAPPQKPV
jgi:hypothetical protein